MNLDELKQYFKADEFFALTGVEILSAEKNCATVGFNVTPRHLNAFNYVHGGMLFTLADAAFGVLSAFLHPHTVTQSAQINYIAPGKSGKITATATELVRNGRNCIHQVIIKNEDGSIICTATVNGFIKDL